MHRWWTGYGHGPGEIGAVRGICLADIIIVRHGNTAWNEIERFRGRAEIELSATGRKQAYATAARLAGLPVSFIYSSPAARAVETANIIAQPHELNVSSLPAVIDIDFGELQGLSQQEARLKYPEVYQWVDKIST